jgi:hypothetical protein
MADRSRQTRSDIESAIDVLPGGTGVAVADPSKTLGRFAWRERRLRLPSFRF